MGFAACGFPVHFDLNRQQVVAEGLGPVAVDLG